MSDPNGDTPSDELTYLASPSVWHTVPFGGEDLCERAFIEHKCEQNGSVVSTMALGEYNDIYVEKMMLKQHREDRPGEPSALTDYATDSIVQSYLDHRLDSESEDYSSVDLCQSSDEDKDSIDELFVDNSESGANKWTPSVFCPPKQDIENPIECVYNLDFDESLDSTLNFSLGPQMPKRFDSCQKVFGFNDSFLDRLKRLDTKDVSLELQLWPSILKGLSISCISGPKTGKTNAYLIPLMNWFDSPEYIRVENDLSVGAIIICSSTRQTYEIARQAKKWREPVVNPKQKVRIVSMNSANESKIFSTILNGCDLLITTPAPLLRTINKSIIDSDNTRCLIIDEADISLALHRKTILEIYLSFASMKKPKSTEKQKKNGLSAKPMAFQTMLFTEKWTKDIKWWTKEVQHMPSVVFGSYYEASIALGIECKVEVIGEEGEREMTVQRLVVRLVNSGQKRIAIVCRTVDEIRYLKRKLTNESIVVTHETPHFNLEALRHQWKKGNSVLLINDSAIRLVSGFKSVMCLIHYKLPFDFDSKFGERFRQMRDNLQKYRNVLNGEKNEKLITYLIVSPTDKELIPKVIEYLKRLNVTPIPHKLKQLCSYERRELCHYFSSLANCPLQSFHCSDRHEFNRFDKPLSGLPVRGQIKIVVTYVKGANEFYFRLNECRTEEQTSGKWERREVVYDDIREELNSLKETPFNTLKQYSMSEVYGIAIRGQVFRVRLTQIFGDEEIHFYQEFDPLDQSQVIEVFCIDFGHKVRTRSRQLFQLPQHLQCLPAFAFRAYLFGIKPIDNEIEWDFRSTQAFYDLVDNYKISRITAWVLKQINGVFWLNRLVVEKRLRNAKMSVDSNPIKYLIDRHIVEQNDKQLPNANNDYSKIVNVWHNSRMNSIAYNACLVDDTTYVVISDFVSVDELYLVKESQVKRLKQLEDKWLSTAGQKLEPLVEVIAEQICFYKHFDDVYQESSLNRAKVVAIDGLLVDVFLVDHGETVRKVQKTALYRIEDSHLQELPFQAIRVALSGFKANKAITYDLICELSRDSEDQYLMAIAQKVTDGVNVIRLFIADDKSETQFTALSKLLVDRNYGHYCDGEEDRDLVLCIDRTQVEEHPFVPSADLKFSEEYLERLEAEFADNLTKECILQMFGLDESEDIDYECNTASSADTLSRDSQMSKVMRRLKALKERNKLNTDSDDEEEEDSKPKTIGFIDYNPGDYDYETNGRPVACYDPCDDSGDEASHSDEDAMFEEEELS